MEKRVISGVLSATSIEQMKDELLRYQQSLKNKNELFVRRLAEIGIPVIDRNIASAKGDSKKSHNTYIKINRLENIHKQCWCVREKICYL